MPFTTNTPSPTTGGTPGVRRGTIRKAATRKGSVAKTNIRGGIASLEASAKKSKKGGILDFARGPVGKAFDIVQRPGYAVGGLIAGKPLGAANEILPFLPGERARIMPGQALARRGLLPGGKTGKVLGFAADIGLDPTTYLTLGAGAGANVARQAALRTAGKSIDDAARLGRVPLSTIARANAQAAQAPAGRVLSAGFRVPMTRGKTVTVARSERGGRALDRALKRTGETTLGRQAREAFLPHGAADKGVHGVYQATRRAGDAEKHAVSATARRLEKEVASAGRALGLPKGAAAAAITRHLDDPKNNPIPPGLEPAAKSARALLDDFHKAEVKAGVEKSLVDTYVPHLPATPKDRRTYERLFPRGPADPFFVKPRELQRLADWDKHGLRPEESIARLVEVRGHASVDERVHKAFDDAIRDTRGATPQQARALTEGYPGAAQVWRDAPGKYMEGTKLPAETAEAVNRVHQRITPNVTPNGLEDTRRFIAQTTASWKALALLSPGYHARNMYSDLMAAYWAGARNPKAFTDAAVILAGRRTTPVKVKGRAIPPDELTRLAEAHGVLRAGFSRVEVERGIDAYRTGVGGVNRPGRGRIARTSQKVGQGREDTVRFGLFLERLRAGDTPMQAAAKTREYLFDYGDVGRFVEFARRHWLPFVTYPSKAIPMVARTFASRPGIPATLAKTQETLNREADVDPELLPVGNRLGVALPLPNSVKRRIGAPTDQPVVFNPENTLPFGSLQLLDPTQPSRYLGGLVTPFVKTPVELATGHSFFTGRQMPGRVRAPAAIVAAERLGVPIPGFGPKTDIYTKKKVPGYSARLDAVLRTLPLWGQSAGLIPGGGTEAARLQRVRYLTGVSATPYDRAKQAFYAERFGGK